MPIGSSAKEPKGKARVLVPIPKAQDIDGRQQFLKAKKTAGGGGGGSPET